MKLLHDTITHTTAYTQHANNIKHTQNHQSPQHPPHSPSDILPTTIFPPQNPANRAPTTTKNPCVPNNAPSNGNLCTPKYTKTCHPQATTPSRNPKKHITNLPTSTGTILLQSSTNRNSRDSQLQDLPTAFMKLLHNTITHTTDYTQHANNIKPTQNHQSPQHPLHTPPGILPTTTFPPQNPANRAPKTTRSPCIPNNTPSNKNLHTPKHTKTPPASHNTLQKPQKTIPAKPTQLSASKPQPAPNPPKINKITTPSAHGTSPEDTAKSAHHKIQ
eukprot:gene2968-1950_t